MDTGGNFRCVGDGHPDGGQREVSETVTPCWTQMDESTGKDVDGRSGRAKALGWG
jgi:hypothetical protein